MFQKLFGGDKKGKDKPKESGGKIEETLQMLDKKIGDMELLLKNLDVRQKNLQEESKQKLKDGYKAGAKRLLAKKKKIIRATKTNRGCHGHDGRTKVDIIIDWSN